MMTICNYHVDFSRNTFYLQNFSVSDEGISYSFLDMNEPIIETEDIVRYHVLHSNLFSLGSHIVATKISSCQVTVSMSQRPQTSDVRRRGQSNDGRWGSRTQ